MDNGFINILKQIVKEQTNAAFADAKKFKGLLADYTKNEYKKESRLIMIAVDAGMAKAINDADDLEACKKTQIRDLDDDYALDTDVAEDIVNTLAFVLRGDTNKTMSPSAAKVAAEKAATDKAAAEKAAAEKAAVEKAAAERAAAKRAAAEKAAADRAAAKKATAAKKAADRAAAKKAAAAKRAARKAARRSSSSSSSGDPIFLIVDRDSGDGSSILFGIIGVAIGLGAGGLIGGFIAIGLGGVIGWGIGHEIGKSIYVNLFAVILAIACGVLIAFLAGWTGNGLFPNWAPAIARIIFIPFMIAGAALFILARNSGNKILLITLVALSIGGAIALTEPPFPFSLQPNKAAAETASEQTAAGGGVAATINSGVNFRTGPSTDNAVIRQLRQGETVILTGETSGGWTQVSHNGDTGWVSSEYLSSSANTAAPRRESASTSAAQTAAYKIGGTGPAGGIIFYDKGGDSDGWRYLEAAPQDVQGTLRADADRPDVNGSMERSVGSGKANSAALLREAASRGGGIGWAVQACSVLVVNGYDDWFLPSRDELNYLYENLHKKGLGNFTNEIYWSSTFDSGVWEWSCIDFSNGRYNALPGAEQHRVRAVRQF